MRTLCWKQKLLPVRTDEKGTTACAISSSLPYSLSKTVKRNKASSGACSVNDKLPLNIGLKPKEKKMFELINHLGIH